MEKAAAFRVEFLDPQRLKKHPQNFRRHPQNQMTALQSSIEEHGYLSAPIWNQRSGHILDGHARIDLALEQKEAVIPVRVIDVSEEQEKRILRMFDAVGGLAEIDTEALDRLIAEIDDASLEQLLGGEEPNFEPASEDEQGRLDQKAQVTCPECGHAFSP